MPKTLGRWLGLGLGTVEAIEAIMDYAVIDVETTGLFPGGHDRIVEVAILRLASDGTISSEYDTLLNPGRDMGPTWLHGIETRDVLDAPQFLDIAGEISRRLSGAVVVGHNVGFDLRFLRSEFARGGFTAPQPPYIDTLSLALRMGSPSRRLEEACTLFGINLAESHSALGDARATAALFVRGIEHVSPPQMHHWVVHPHPGEEGVWPTLEARRPPMPRRTGVQHSQPGPSFVSSLVRQLPASGDQPGNWQLYYAILDRALEDRRLSSDEVEALQQAAHGAGLSASDIRSANEAYLRALIELALRDGVLSKIEERDIEQVAGLLGLGEIIPELLAEGSDSSSIGDAPRAEKDIPLSGRTVCFTGALNASINGQRATRDKATSVATAHGMVVVKGVTKKLDYLVIADPHSLSGKAKKARQYGTRILAESVFWQLMDVDTDG